LNLQGRTLLRLQDLTTRAGILRDEGKPDEAEPLLRRALALAGGGSGV